MHPHTRPVSPSPSGPTAALAPGQSLWLCLAPKEALRATRGEVAVRFAPQSCGPVLHTPPHAVLRAGEHLPCPTPGGAAVWVQLSNPVCQPAEVQVMQAPPGTGLLQPLVRRLRHLLAGRRQVREATALGAHPAPR